MKKKIKSYFSLKLVRVAFVDVVSGKSVSIYEDCYGEQWLKDSKWSFFRVKKCKL